MEDLKKYTLLIVDDDTDLRELMYCIFEMQGFNVLSAESGDSAFEVCQNNKVDLIVSDMCMPEGDGMSLLNRIRANHSEIPPLIFVTGHTDFSLDECLKKGARGVFAKPFNHAELVHSIKEALGIGIQITS